MQPQLFNFKRQQVRTVTINKVTGKGQQYFTNYFLVA